MHSCNIIVVKISKYYTLTECICILVIQHVIDSMHLYLTYTACH
jgi:hypothetical protein